MVKYSDAYLCLSVGVFSDSKYRSANRKDRNMKDRLPPNRFRMLDTMEDIRQNCSGRLYANLFTVKEFSKTFDIGINTVYKLCRLEDFPVIQIGGKKYIVANDFNEWIMRNTGKVITL